MTQRNFPMAPPVVASSVNLTRMRLTVGTDSFLAIGELPEHSWHLPRLAQTIRLFRK